jgi:hypothetical protein
VLAREQPALEVERRELAEEMVWLLRLLYERVRLLGLETLPLLVLEPSSQLGRSLLGLL